MMLAKDNTGMRTVMAIIAIAIISILYTSSAAASSTGTTVHYIINTTTTYGVNLTQPANQTINISSDAVYTITVTNNGSAIDSFTLTLDNTDNASTAALNQTAITNLSPGSSFNVTLTIGDNDPGNYTATVTATSQGDNSSYDNVSVTTEVIPDVLIINTLISPYAAINGSNVTLFIDAENYHSVWAVITRPDNTTQNITLTDEANTIYSNTGLTGTYNVTFYANGTLGNVKSVKDYFEVFYGIIIDLDVIDSNATGINSTFISYYRNGSVAINSSAIGKYIVELANALLDTKFYAHNNKITVTIWNQNVSDMHNKYIGIDRHNQTTGYIITYGVEPEWTATNATLRIYYDDLNYTYENMLKLDKCANYNFTGRQCLGTWADVTGQAIQDTTQDYFEIDVTGFSGFSIREETTIPPVICVGCGPGPGPGPDHPETCTEDWVCKPWEQCFNGQQTRACVDINDCGTDEYRPDTRISCFIPCNPSWECGEWSTCDATGTQTRECSDNASCGTRRGMPATRQHCAYDSCSDSIQNNGEEGTDCGGICPPCATLEMPRTIEYAESNILCLLLIILEMVLLVMLIMIRAARLPKIPTKAIAIINIVLMVLILLLLIPGKGCPSGACMAIADTMPIIEEIIIFLYALSAIILIESIAYLIVKALTRRRPPERPPEKPPEKPRAKPPEKPAEQKPQEKKRPAHPLRKIGKAIEKSWSAVTGIITGIMAKIHAAQRMRSREAARALEREKQLRQQEEAERRRKHIEKMHEQRLGMHEKTGAEEIIRSYEEELEMLRSEIDDVEKEIKSTESAMRAHSSKKKDIIETLQQPAATDLEHLAGTQQTKKKERIELMVHHVMESKTREHQSKLTRLKEHKLRLAEQYERTRKDLNKTKSAIKSRHEKTSRR